MPPGTGKLLGALGAAVAFACGAPERGSAAPIPRPQHTIVVVEENKSLAQIDGNASAPFINGLFVRGALFTNAHGVTHPSLPNYLALFAGVTNDNGDGCPATGISVRAANLASELAARRLSFAGYSEALPAAGSTVCAAGTYARKHAPWVAFSNVPKHAGRPFSALPAYDALPTVAFVVPGVDDDMHDGTIAAGDDWLARHLGKLVAWANAHDSLVVLTWDEGYDRHNTVPTVLLGPMVKPGRYAQRIDHLSVLRTIEDAYGLPHAGNTGTALPLQGCWR